MNIERGMVMTVDMPNALRTFLITTSRDEAITMSATSEWEVRKLFATSFPRKRISTVHEYPQDVLKVSGSFQ
jgi:hypothetical protein